MNLTRYLGSFKVEDLEKEAADNLGSVFKAHVEPISDLDLTNYPTPPKYEPPMSRSEAQSTINRWANTKNK